MTDSTKNIQNQQNRVKPKLSKHNAYEKPTFDAYETTNQKQQPLNVEVKQQAQLFQQWLGDADMQHNTDITKIDKPKTASSAAQKTMQQDEQQRQIASIASHLASQFTQQQFSVEMPNLGRLNIKVETQEAYKQLAFCIETSDNQTKTWLNQHQASIGKAFQTQTGWQASIKVI
jgi:K+/H+ antiporter YhaU regulatory subunit KhtT